MRRMRVQSNTKEHPQREGARVHDQEVLAPDA